MIVKYINEGAFGSYKDKTNKEDKLNRLKSDTAKILDKAAKKLTDSVKETIYFLLDELAITLPPDPEDFPFYELATMRGDNLTGNFAYDVIESKDNPGENIAIPFLTNFKVDGKTLNVDVKIPIAFSNNVVELIPFLNPQMVENMYTVIDETPKNIEPDVYEKLKDWYNVDDIKFNVKYHLMNEDEPEKFFNKNITKNKILLVPTSRTTGTINEMKNLVKSLISMFEWWPPVHVNLLYGQDEHIKKYFGDLESMIDVVSMFSKVENIDVINPNGTIDEYYNINNKFQLKNSLTVRELILSRNKN